MHSGRHPQAPKSVGCTCLRLRKAARRVSQIYDRALEPCGLTVTQYGLLGHIGVLDGVGLGALAAKLVMDPTTLTRNLKVMLRQGWIAEAPDDIDQRGAPLKITAQGRKLLESIGPAWQRAQARAKRLLGADGVELLFAVRERVRAKPG